VSTEWAPIVPNPDPEHPDDCRYSMFPGLPDGTRVRGRHKNTDEWLTGTVDFLWLGIEEAIQVTHDDGTKSSYYPQMGDQLERRA
jgi:hypothetical protein